MAYFAFTEDCQHYPAEWENSFNHIKNDWPEKYKPDLGDLQHHIEVKALYVFSMSTRLIERAQYLSRKPGWRSVFIESLILLFPMIELVGQARLGNDEGQLLGSGIDWLCNPQVFLTPSRTASQMRADASRVTSLGDHMETLREGPRVQKLFHLRNYFLHGLKNVGPMNRRDPNFDIGAVQTSINYELPQAIIQQANENLYVYWEQLKTADNSVSRNWITRLAEADIYPFRIIGSSIFEHGVIHPNIVYWLSQGGGIS